MGDSSESINVLSLCSGGAGLDLGVKLAIPGARVVCWSEWEAFACAELVRRMEEGELDAAPLWTDTRTFAGKQWRGVVDCIIAGYPCQPFSDAGKRGGSDDPRYLWPHVRRVVSEVQPAIVFFENVSGHVSLGLREVCEDLERLGYEVACGLFTASEVGAPHKRERVFILGLADADEPGPQGRGVPGCGRADERVTRHAGSAGMGNSERTRRQATGKRRHKHAGTESETGSGIPLFPPGPGERERWTAILRDFPHLAPAATKPDICRVADGLADNRSRYLRLEGNGVVPLCASYAFVWLWNVVRADAG